MFLLSSLLKGLENTVPVQTSVGVAGTGANMLQVLDGTAGLGPPALSGGPHRCNWSQVVATNFPDSGTRSCAAAMPRTADGRSGGVWVIGNSPGSKVCRSKRGSFLAGLLALSKQGSRRCTDDRFTLTLSVAQDGKCSRSLCVFFRRSSKQRLHRQLDGG